MNRYYIEADFCDLPCTAEVLDGLFCPLTEGLLDLEQHKPDICDPSVGVSLGDRTLNVYLVVDADSPEEAVRVFLTCVRSTLHGLGVATPGWDQMIHAVSFQVSNDADLALNV